MLSLSFWGKFGKLIALSFESGRERFCGVHEAIFYLSAAHKRQVSTSVSMRWSRKPHRAVGAGTPLAAQRAVIFDRIARSVLINLQCHVAGNVKPVHGIGSKHSAEARMQFWYTPRISCKRNTHLGASFQTGSEW